MKELDNGKIKLEKGEYAPKKVPNRKKPYSKEQISLREDSKYQATPDTVRKICVVAEMISKGMSRVSVQKWIVDNYGVCDRTARHYYKAGLKLLIPNAEEFDEYKKAMLQVNIDRLEKIIEGCIDGTTADKKVAKECISELNKIIGVGGNSVTIARNDDEEIIHISFDK